MFELPVASNTAMAIMDGSGKAAAVKAVIEQATE
jgi:hypothetical protein